MFIFVQIQIETAHRLHLKVISGKTLSHSLLCSKRAFKEKCLQLASESSVVR